MDDDDEDEDDEEELLDEEQASLRSLGFFIVGGFPVPLKTEMDPWSPVQTSP